MILSDMTCFLGFEFKSEAEGKVPIRLLCPNSFLGEDIA